MHNITIVLEIYFPKISRGKSTTNNFGAFYISSSIFDIQSFNSLAKTHVTVMDLITLFTCEKQFI